MGGLFHRLMESVSGVFFDTLPESRCFILRLKVLSLKKSQDIVSEALDHNKTDT